MLDLLQEQLGLVPRPGRAASPLGRHHAGEGVGDADRGGFGGGDQVARLGETFLLLVDQVEHRLEAGLAEGPGRGLLQEPDQRLGLLDVQVQHRRVDQLVPAMAAQLPPGVGRIVEHRPLIGEVAGAIFAGPQLIDLAVIVIAGIADHQGRAGQAAPGRRGRVLVERRGEAEREVLLLVVRIAALAQPVQVVRRLLLGRDQRGPPLHGDIGDIHGVQDLDRGLGAHQGERLSGGGAGLQVLEPGAQVGRGVPGRRHPGTPPRGLGCVAHDASRRPVAARASATRAVITAGSIR